MNEALCRKQRRIFWGCDGTSTVVYSDPGLIYLRIKLPYWGFYYIYLFIYFFQHGHKLNKCHRSQKWTEFTSFAFFLHSGTLKYIHLFIHRPTYLLRITVNNLSLSFSITNKRWSVSQDNLMPNMAMSDWTDDTSVFRKLECLYAKT